MRRRFYLTAVTFNLGRHYPAARFRANLDRILDHVDDRTNVVLLPQELDEEPDPLDEHHELGRRLPPGTRRVYWRTREPILLSPTFTVVRRRRVQTMGSGQAIGAAPGTGPARHAVTAIVRHQPTGILLAAGNTHPHRRGLSPRVDAAQDAGLDTFAAELQRARRSYGGTSGLWGADLNDATVPRLVEGERVAAHDGLDHLRYWRHPAGARLTVIDSGVLDGTIDPHDFPWARFLVEAPTTGGTR